MLSRCSSPGVSGVGAALFLLLAWSSPPPPPPPGLLLRPGQHPPGVAGLGPVCCGLWVRLPATQGKRGLKPRVLCMAQVILQRVCWPRKCRFPQRHRGQQRAWVLRPTRPHWAASCRGSSLGSPREVGEGSEVRPSQAGRWGFSVQGTWADSCHSRVPWCHMWPGHSPPAAGPHRRSAAGTPRCSPAAPARTAALASSLSETWAPGLRTPGGWGCWASLQPSGNLETGGHSQSGSGSPDRSPRSAPDLPQLSRLH